MIKIFKRFQYTPASYALIAMNLIPLIGVFALGWDAGTIVFLYWLENVVIGLLNIPKLLSCRGGMAKFGEKPVEATGVFARKDSQPGERPSLGVLIFLSAFFAVHYGMFCFGHYMFIQMTFRGLPTLEEMPEVLTTSFLIWPLLGLALSHFISLLVNFYGKKEYLTRSAPVQMFMPYTRIVVLHVVIIFGAFLSLILNEGLATLIMLIIIKTGVDLFAHQIEHSGLKSLINPKIAEES